MSPITSAIIAVSTMFIVALIVGTVCYIAVKCSD